MSIGKTDSRIELYSRELLITLDYLTNKTNEKKPASRIAICNYADETYGLKYDKNQEKGNKIDRTRVTKYLEFLYELSINHPDEFPFVIEKTDGGKYYLDQKNSMDESFLIKLLSHIRNDKNISQEDEEYYSKRLLDTFSAKINHERIEKEVDKLDMKVIKNSLSLETKLKTIKTAIEDKESIRIRNIVYDTTGDKVKKMEYLYLYRVYALREINHRPFVILVPVSSDVDVRLYYNVRCDFVENLDIVKGTVEDEKYDGRINDLFKKNVPLLYEKFGSIDKYVESAIIPVSAGYSFVAFSFNINLLKVVKAQFENIFNQKLEYKTCSKFEVEGKKIRITDSNNPIYAIAYTKVNTDAFVSFLLSDPYNTGKTNISDMVEVIFPSIIYNKLKDYYKRHYEKYLKINSEK